MSRLALRFKQSARLFRIRSSACLIQNVFSTHVPLRSNHLFTQISVQKRYNSQQASTIEQEHLSHAKIERLITEVNNLACCWQS